MNDPMISTETIDKMQVLKNDFKTLSPQEIEARLKQLTSEEVVILLKLYIYEGR